MPAHAPYGSLELNSVFLEHIPLYIRPAVPTLIFLTAWSLAVSVRMYIHPGAPGAGDVCVSVPLDLFPSHLHLDVVIPGVFSRTPGVFFSCTFLASRSDDGNHEVRHRPDRWPQLSGSSPLRLARPRTRADVSVLCALCLCLCHMSPNINVNYQLRFEFVGSPFSEVSLFQACRFTLCLCHPCRTNTQSLL